MIHRDIYKVSRFVASLACSALLGAGAVSFAETGTASPLTFKVKNIDGQEVDLAQYQGKVVMIVNVASKCGLTPQYEKLEALYDKYKDQGLVILGFPANNFLGQEPGTEEEIKLFCKTKYDVSFDMFSKISVDGKDIDPLYALLTSPEKNGKFGGSIKWNFTKFLVGRNGEVVARFEPKTKPDAPEVVLAVETALARKAG
jgi:glutathione peroxidase